MESNGVEIHTTTDTDLSGLSSLLINISGSDVKHAKYHMEQAEKCLKRAASSIRFHVQHSDGDAEESLMMVKHEKIVAILKCVSYAIDAGGGINESWLVNYGKGSPEKPEIDLVTQAVATKYFGLKRGIIQSWVSRGKIPYYDVMGDRWVKLGDIDRFMNSNND